MDISTLTKEELLDALEKIETKEREEKEKAEKEEKERLKAERATRAKEVEDAFKEAAQMQKKANQLLEDFTNDYHSFHMTIKDSDCKNTHFSDLMDWMLSRF